MRRCLLIAAMLLLPGEAVAQTANPWFNLYIEQSNRPAGKIAREVVAKGLIGTVSTNPLGWMAAGTWKGADLLASLGDGALHAEDEHRRTLVVATNADALLLKALHDEGADLKTDPRAIAAKARLKQAGERMSASGLDSGAFLYRVTQRHFGVAVSRVAMKEFASWGLGRLGELGPGRWLTSQWYGRKVAGLVDGRGRWRNQLRANGWSRFGDRAKAAKAMVENVAKALNDVAADRIVDEFLDMEGADGFDLLCRRLNCFERTTPIYRPLLRIETARLSLPVAPRAATPLPQPVMVAAPARAPEIRPYRSSLLRATITAAPAAARAAPASDPQWAVIDYEDRSTWRSQGLATPAPPPPPPPPEPEIRQGPTAQQLRWKEEWRCAGGFAKPGCGDPDWDGRNQRPGGQRQ